MLSIADCSEIWRLFVWFRRKAPTEPDEEQKKVVDLKWKPNVGDDYYSILFSNKYGFFPLCYGWDNSSVDMDVHNKGWVFRTREECEEFCNRLNDAINSVKP